MSATKERRVLYGLGDQSPLSDAWKRPGDVLKAGLPRAKDSALAQQTAEGVARWLAAEQSGDVSWQELYAELDRTPQWSFHFLLVRGTDDPLWPLLEAHIDQRLALKGWTYSAARGWHRPAQIDAAREERAAPAAWRDHRAEGRPLPRREGA